MIALKKYIIVVLFLFFASAVNAANGCYVSGTDRMYYQTPNGTNTYFQGASYYVGLAHCNHDGQYFGNLSATSTNCWAVYDGNGSTTSSSNYVVSGKKATFTVLNCPIDTYSILFLALIGGAGFFFLRKPILNPLV